MATERVCAVALIATEQISGPGRQLAALAQELKKQGTILRIIVFQRRGRPVPEYSHFLNRCGIEHDVVEDRGPLDVMGIARRVAALLEKSNSTVLQSHGYKATAVAFMLRRAFGHRWVGFYHGHTRESRRAEVYHWLDRRMLRSADRVVVMSNRQAAQFAPCAERVRVIHNAVIPLIAIGSTKEALQWKEVLLGAPGRRVGVVGRLSYEKGVDVLLSAMGLLAERGTEFTLFVVGDGPEREALEALARKLKIEHRVRWIGRLESVSLAYSALDLLVIPSRSEGLPNVLLEALAHGVPVVSTDVGAVSEVLSGSKVGWLVPVEDPISLAEAIASALTSSGNVATRNTCIEVAARFSLERRAEYHLHLYSEVVEHGAGLSRVGAPR